MVGVKHKTLKYNNYKELYESIVNARYFEQPRTVEILGTQRDNLSLRNQLVSGVHDEIADAIVSSLSKRFKEGFRGYRMGMRDTPFGG